MTGASNRKPLAYIPFTRTPRQGYEEQAVTRVRVMLRGDLVLGKSVPPQKGQQRADNKPGRTKVRDINAHGLISGTARPRASFFFRAVGALLEHAGTSKSQRYNKQKRFGSVHLRSPVLKAIPASSSRLVGFDSTPET